MSTLERQQYIYVSAHENITKYISEQSCSLRSDGLTILKGPRVAYQILNKTYYIDKFLRGKKKSQGGINNLIN